MSQTATDIASCLLRGGVVLMPTDTVLGLAVSPAFSEAVDRLYAIKARPRVKNLPIMVANADQITELGAIVTKPAKRLLASDYMPGPLTLVLSLDATEAPAWLAGRDEIAVRIPADPLLLSVLAQTGPLLVTSANLSGQDAAATTPEALEQLTEAPDMTVHGKGQSAQPSTLVNCRSVPVSVERIGAVSAQSVFEIVGGPDV